MTERASLNAAAAATAFVEARIGRTCLPVYPGPFPATLQEAYAVQDAAIAAMSQPVVGWKLGRVGESAIACYGARRIVGPVFQGNVVKASGAPIEMNVIEGGFAAVEAEFIVRIAHDCRATPEEHEFERLIDSVRLGIELAGSPYPEINDHGPAVTASDFCCNMGLIVGRELPRWRETINQQHCTVEIDGALRGQGAGADIPDGMIGSLRALMTALEARGLSLRAGDWVSTGAIGGVHPIRTGQRARITFTERDVIDVVVASA